MAEKITLDLVRHVARLSRLSLTDDRMAKLAGELESILGYIAKLQSVDVSGVEPMAHALPIKNIFREDIVEPSLTVEQVFANAPDADPPFFKVPKVIGGDEDSAG